MRVPPIALLLACAFFLALVTGHSQSIEVCNWHTLTVCSNDTAPSVFPWPQGLYNTSGSQTDVDASHLTLPSGTVAYVSNSGLDSNTGSISLPYKTLHKAVTVLQTASGGSIVMRAGTYTDDGRDDTVGVITVTKPIKVQAYPNEAVRILGYKPSTAFGTWTQDGTFTNLYWIPYTLKCSHVRPTSYDPSASTWPYPEVVVRDIASAPLMYSSIMDVLVSSAVSADDVNNINLTASLTRLNTAAANSYFVDRKNSRMYINTNPSGHTLELSHKKSLIKFSANTAANSSFDGIYVAGFASHNTEDGAAVSTLFSTAGGPFFARYCTFAWNGGRGLSTTQADNGSIVSSNVFAFNGGQGFYSVRSDGELFLNNAVVSNNLKNWATGWEGAGAKVSQFVGGIVRGNLFENNNGRGWWFDGNSHRSTVVENWFNHNQIGFMLEISHGLIFASNIVTNNTNRGVLIANAGGTDPIATGIDFPCYIFNNTFADNNSFDLHINDTSRTSQTEDPTSFAAGYDWEAYNIQVENNLFASTTSGTLSAARAEVCVEHATNLRYAAQMIDMGEWNRNGYWRANTGLHANIVKWQAEASSTFKLLNATIASFKAAVIAEHSRPVPYATAYVAPYYETNAIAHDGATEPDPWFVDSVGTMTNDRSFTLRAGVDALSGAAVLPDRVADALGLARGTIPRMGKLW